MATVEKICRKHVIQSRRTALYNRFLKHRASKLWRKAGKVLLDDAPIKRPTRGWSD